MSPGNDWPRIGWREAEPQRLVREREEMASLASDLEWLDERPAGGWWGRAPEWPFQRARPDGLDNLLAGRRLLLEVEYSEGFPMAEPRLWPLEPEPPIERRIQHIWHLNGNGTLCLLRTASDWNGSECAAQLVVKASGWVIEYLLMEAGAIEAMSEEGIYSDAQFDPLIETFAV
jgi:hypothetical protein